MQDAIPSFVGLLLGGAVLCLSPAAQSAMPGNHAVSQDSLLAECQGPSALPSPSCGRAPSPVFALDGRLWVAFSQHGHVYVAGSRDLGKTFSPAVAVNRGVEAIYDDGENRPKIAMGPDGELFVSWTQKTEGRYAGDVRFARSLDAGQSFGAPLTVNDDHAQISHRFDALQVDGKGHVYLVWIDKRDLTEAKQAGEDYAGAALYFSVSEDRGRSFKPNRKLVDHSCECCRLALDLDAQDKVTVLWRHVYPVNLRDHAIARLDDAPIIGLPQQATDDGWQVEGCPHHGPDLALDAGHKAHMMWFSQGKKNRGLTYGRFDLGRGRMDFQQAVDASAAASRPQILVTGDAVVRAWKRFDGARTQLMVGHSTDQGETWTTDEAVAGTTGDSDHPLLTVNGHRVFVSWQTRADGYRLIPLALRATP